MYKRWLGGGMFNPDYERGVEMFLDFAFSSMENISYSEILCPCMRCANRFSLLRDDVKQHLYYNGFMPAYYTWTAHGENFLSSYVGSEYGSSSSSVPQHGN